MRLFDLHSHWGTKRGYVLQTPEDLAQQQRTWGSSPTYDTEEQMAEYFRAQQRPDDSGFRFHQEHDARPGASVSRLRDRDAAALLRRDLRQLAADRSATRRRRPSTRLERCIDESDGFIGYCVSAAGHGLPRQRPDLRPVLSTLARQRHPGAGAGGLHRLGRGHPGRQRRQARSLSPALRRRARDQLSDAEDHHRPAGVAVAGRDDRRDAAQAQRVGRAARLVAEVSDRAAATRHCAPAEEIA